MPPREPPQFPPPWASAWGDDHHGLWADLDVQGVIQRLRWIEPGAFLMGRPNAEGGTDDEVPQHHVRLSHGFWLADTACTQALWLVVMGRNPSHFKGDDQCPVETVSHLDVVQFLQQLQPLCEGDEAALPTEAEWEYACRAGTTTAFSVGPNITPAQVNYDGRYPYGDAAKGLYRERTVPVKALPANAWGLHQMHGNVWEWCADGRRPYRQLADGEVVMSPTGPLEPGPEAHRAARGGAWRSRAHRARSAFRGADQRRGDGSDLGFRFALRSTSTGAPEGPGAPEALERV